ncbi:sodium:alanine symporter family protein [Roseiconus nitratireducens]|uniref:Sodium:alanine symporter family protein n=1 Tax=Roseiconus nitratireducens TaxID=2605748 RepID=A0A5M6DNV0_9BACT|nr:amino acid carrier protein [Roseiconus nitratireducens]KAA5547115.1 sodium:alanine symporter family protein [Roseiconus nitratireducens]
MMNFDFGILDSINSILWGPWTPYVLLACGVLFSIWTRFIQFTVMTHGVQVVRGVYDDPDDPGVISHFQALSAALSATVGLGNIGGVALAVGVGGPGALFWMWIVGILGMALKSVEITLAMMYRNTTDPENPHGGAMWVVEAVVGSRGGVWSVVARCIGIFFCITLVIATFTSGNMFQAWSVAELTESYFAVPKVMTGIVMAVIVGLVIVGGIKRIGSVAGKLVPFMCLLYLVSAFTVLAVHMSELPGILNSIIQSAFQPTEAKGAFIGGSAGWAFIQGMKRAFFSNEAGLGSAPIAHAAAKTDEPAREGIVGGLGPFIDTLCICTVTGLVILSTQTWNRAAVGSFNGPVAIKAVPSDEAAEATPTAFTIDASDDATLLPIDPSGDWTVGSRFYFVGKVGGASHRESGSGRVKFFGEIRSDDDAATTINWIPVTENGDNWNGAVTDVTLESAEVYREYAGAELTGFAFDRDFPGLGRWLVTLAAWLFAVSSMISWSYYGEQGMVYLFGDRSVFPFKLAFLVGVIYAANWIEDANHMMMLMDLGTGAMLWSNIPIVLALGYLAIGSLDTYKKSLREGRFKVHRGASSNDT